MIIIFQNKELLWLSRCIRTKEWLKNQDDLFTLSSLGGIELKSALIKAKDDFAKEKGNGVQAKVHLNTLPHCPGRGAPGCTGVHRGESGCTPEDFRKIV